MTVRSSTRPGPAAWEDRVLGGSAMVASPVVPAQPQRPGCRLPCPWRDDTPCLHDGTDMADTAALLKLCGNMKSLARGQCVHNHIIENGYEHDVSLNSRLIHMYSDCNALDDALACFCQSGTRDPSLWGLMIKALAQQGCIHQALHLFGFMQWEEMVPDKPTVAALLSACADERALIQGKQVHACIQSRGLQTDVLMGTALIQMYGKCGCLDEAEQVFSQIHNPNVITWTTLISVYTQNNKGKEALQFFRLMQQSAVIPNKGMHNTDKLGRPFSF